MIRAEAVRLLECLLQVGKYRRGEGGRFAGWNVELKQRWEAAGLVARQPAPDGIATDPKQTGNVLAGVGLATGEEIEHLEAGFLAPVMLMLQVLFQFGRGLGNGREFSIHAG